MNLANDTPNSENVGIRVDAKSILRRLKKFKLVHAYAKFFLNRLILFLFFLSFQVFYTFARKFYLLLLSTYVAHTLEKLGWAPCQSVT